MRVYILLCLIFVNSALMAYDIDEVLELYRKENDLSKKTKNESLGNVTVYTRDDIERMQAHTLSDLINTLRSFRYDENMFGMPDVMHTDPSLYSSDLIKIFINNYEITSSYTGSGLYVYGNIDLGFVDHVEIYEGSTSTYVNAEPSVVTIKLYSKNPAREVGGHAQAYAGSRGTNHENISYAGISEDFEYYIYGSRTDANRVQYTNAGHNLSRDYKDIHTLASFKYKNIDFDFEIIDHKSDAFLALSMFATPNPSDMDYTFERVSTTIKFLDDESLKLQASFIRIDSYLNFDMDRTRRTADIVKIATLAQDQLVSNALDDTFTIKLEKTQKIKNHHITMGTEYLSKRMHDVETYNNGIYDTTPTSIDNSIFSGYIEDDYTLAKEQSLNVSYKLNHYNSNNNRVSKVFDTHQFRLGYIYSLDNDVFKLFYSYMELPTEQYVLASNSLNTIDILAIDDITMEYTKNIEQMQLGFCFEYTRNENPNSFVEEGLVPSNYNNYSASVKFNYFFDEFNKLNSMLYLNKIHNAVDTQQQTIVGGYARVLNTYKKYDFFNELVYYRITNTPINGTSYNMGIRYKYTNDLIFSFKGTNVFDSAAKSSYQYLDPVTYEVNELYYSVIDRLFTVSVGYSF